MAVKHNSTHTADNQLTAAEYNEAHTVEANTIVDADIGAHTTTKITSPEAQVTFSGTGHAHGGGTDGKQVTHANLGSVTSDQHHARSHNHSDALDNNVLNVVSIDVGGSTGVLIAADAPTNQIGQLRLVNKQGGQSMEGRLTAYETRFVFELEGGATRFAALTIENPVGTSLFEFHNDGHLIMAKPALDMKIASQWDPAASAPRTLSFGVPTGADVKGTFTEKFKLDSGGFKTDVIGEITAAAGVTIDGVLLKDGLTDGVDVSVHDPATTAVHGVGAGAIVGTTLAQTLTNKQRQLQKPADGGWDGDIFVGTAAVDLAIGDLVYVNGSTQWAKTDADTEALSNGLLGIALETILATATGRILLYGFLRRDAAYAWTVGARLYVSPTVGAITETRPSTTGQFVRVVGWAYDADTIFFAPDTIYVEIA